MYISRRMGLHRDQIFTRPATRHTEGPTGSVDSSSRCSSLQRTPRSVVAFTTVSILCSCRATGLDQLILPPPTAQGAVARPPPDSALGRPRTNTASSLHPHRHSTQPPPSRGSRVV